MEEERKLDEGRGRVFARRFRVAGLLEEAVVAYLRSKGRERWRTYRSIRTDPASASSQRCTNSSAFILHESGWTYLTTTILKSGSGGAFLLNFVIGL